MLFEESGIAIPYVSWLCEHYNLGSCHVLLHTVWAKAMEYKLKNTIDPVLCNHHIF